MRDHTKVNFWEEQIKVYDTKVTKELDKQEDRAEMSQNLLSELRNFVQAVEVYIYLADGNKTSEALYKLEIEANKYCQNSNNTSFLSKLYDNLNSSEGHISFVGEQAERLFLKYIPKLFLIKKLLSDKYNIQIFHTLNTFPFNLDKSLQNYYFKISKKLKKEDVLNKIGNTGTYYIQKKKMIYINNMYFYEYTLSNALDKNSKFDRFLAFSLLNIPSNYAIKATIHSVKIEICNQQIDHEIVTNFEIAIRPCEIEKLYLILGTKHFYTSKTQEYYRLMNYLKDYHTNLSKIIEYQDEEFESFSRMVFLKKNTTLKRAISKCRKIVASKSTGSNTLLYLLYRMNNDILKKQIPKTEDDSLSGIKLCKGVISFDKTPFSADLLNHIPSFRDLFNIFNYNEHQGEIIAREISNQSNKTSCIYINKSLISNENITDMLNKYNEEFKKENLYSRKIGSIGNYLFLTANETNSIEVLNILKDYANKINLSQYKEFCASRISELHLEFQDPKKESALKSLFEYGSVFAVYGPAGTGKSFFASYVLKILNDMEKICISTTNAAVENMRRKINDNSAKYMTIEQYLNSYGQSNKIDLLVIDECTTVSTRKMLSILKKTKPQLILLLGDVFQIQSIEFGNWFSLFQKNIEKKYYVELDSQFRTGKNVLKELWKDVRNLESNIQEQLEKYKISHEDFNSLFEKDDDDEIVLCMNYDGLYGINNINKILQSLNPSKEYKWKQYVFKENDPIIFNDNYKYKEIFYNNLKGKILKIEEISKGFNFTVRVERTLNPLACKKRGIKVKKINDQNHTTDISFFFNKYSDDVYDTDTDFSIYMPFQVAYALSIHKAQGLEYNSVKIVISNEIEESITHNLFYTAITRAKNNLAIYWTPETENKVISSIKLQNCNNDYNILKEKMKNHDQ